MRNLTSGFFVLFCFVFHTLYTQVKPTTNNATFKKGRLSLVFPVAWKFPLFFFFFFYAKVEEGKQHEWRKKQSFHSRKMGEGERGFSSCDRSFFFFSSSSLIVCVSCTAPFEEMQSRH